MPKQRRSKKKDRSIVNAEIHVRMLPPKLGNELGLENDVELYGVTIDSEFLKTPHGTLITHEDERAMRELAAELDYSDELDATKISLYGLYSTKIEFVDKDRPDFTSEFLTWSLLNDQVFKPCAGPEMADQMKYLGAVVDYIKGNGFEYPNLPQIPLNEESLKEWLGEDGIETLFNKFHPLVGFVQASIQNLSNHQMSVFLTTAQVFASPTLGLMLANKLLTANEFAVIYLTTLAINSKIWSETDRDEEKMLLAIYTKQAECMLRYLDQFSPKLTEAEEIIKRGESLNVEFKSSLRWNIKENRKDRKMEHAVLKTVAAFLNTDGGTLLVGVEDNRNVLGLEIDGFENEDKYLLHFTNLVKAQVGQEFFSLIKYEIQRANGGKVLLVRCVRSPKPVLLKVDEKDVFFVRAGPSSIPLSMSEMLDYWKTRS